MTDTDDQPPLEQAVDDLLLLIERAAAGLPANVDDVLALRMGEAFGPALSSWVATHKSQAKGAMKSAGIVSEAAAGFSAAYYRLAMKVVLHAADELAVSPAQVIADATREG